MTFEKMIHTVNDEVNTPEEIYREMKEAIKEIPEESLAYWQGRLDSWNNLANLLEMFKKGIENKKDEWTDFEEGIYMANDEICKLLKKLSTSHSEALLKLTKEIKQK